MANSANDTSTQNRLQFEVEGFNAETLRTRLISKVSSIYGQRQSKKDYISSSMNLVKHSAITYLEGKEMKLAIMSGNKGINILFQ